jgi:imidazolonepropionase-like amidohydrolase
MSKRLIIGAALLALAAPLAAQDIAIVNATVVTGDGEPIEGGAMVVRGGRVVFAGPAAQMPATRAETVIDGAGKWVTPGLFAAMTTIGLYDAEAVDAANDITARNSPFGAALDVAPALNPQSQGVSVARSGGITRASVAPQPASSIFAGQGAIVDLGSDPRMVTRPRAFQLVALGESGGNLAGGSRVSAHAVLRNALREARQYGKDSQIPGGSGPATVDFGDDVPVDARLVDNRAEREDVLLTRFDAAALVPVVRGAQPLYVMVNRASDIRAVLALKGEFPALRLVLVGAAEGWLAADAIAAAGVPVITQPLVDLPASFEQLGATQSNVGRMVRAGVKVALGGMTGGSDAQPRNLKQFAGNLVALSKVPGASGLTWSQAFAAITSVPAEIAGLGARAGRLAPGAAGDLVVWDGDPLEVTTTAERVFVDGVEQSRSDHQTRLKDRYLDLDESDLPKAYDW